MADELKRINALQRKIIVASIAYYEYDERIMSGNDCLRRCAGLQSGVIIMTERRGYDAES